MAASQQIVAYGERTQESHLILQTVTVMESVPERTVSTGFAASEP